MTTTNLRKLTAHEVYYFIYSSINITRQAASDDEGEDFFLSQPFSAPLRKHYYFLILKHFFDLIQSQLNACLMQSMGEIPTCLAEHQVATMDIPAQCVAKAWLFNLNLPRKVTERLLAAV